MSNLKTIRLFWVLLLISACAAVATAQVSSQAGSSTDLSLAQTSVRELIAELEAPIKCPPDDTICTAEFLDARLKSALLSLRSLVRIYAEQEGIIQMQERHIGKQDQIIAKYEKLDVNNQRIDTNSQRIDVLGLRNEQLHQEQHADDKRTIGDLKAELDSCRGNQKWIALLSGFGGGFIGYKIRGAGQFQNPFTPQSSASFQLVETQAERMLLERLKVIKGLRIEK